MNAPRPFCDALGRLRRAGLRPTRQRLALARLLFAAGDRHVTAEQLHGEATASRAEVSLATVYNTLNQFVKAGLLREVVAEPGRSYFDTNVRDHHHFYFVDEARLEDIPAAGVAVECLSSAPPGSRIDRIDVVVRLRKD